MFINIIYIEKPKMTNRVKTLSIVIPARNEEATISGVLEEVDKVIKNLKGTKFEIIVVDDGSTDKTFEISKKYTNKVFTNTGEHGKGNALRFGFNKATGDVIIMMDADYSHIASDIPKFIEKINEGYSFVIGSRALGGSGEYTLVRSFGNWALTQAFRIFFGIKLSDPLNGYKAFVKDIVKNYNYKSSNFEIEIELIANALKYDGKIIEFPSFERERAGGEMKSKALREGIRFLLAIIKHGIKYRASNKS